MKKQLSGREQKILVLCVLTGLGALFYSGVIVPMNAKKDSLRQEVAVQQKRLDKDLKIIRKAEALEETYAFFVQKFRQPGTGEETVSSILSEIEEVAGKLGLHVADLKPKKVNHNEYDNQFSVSLMIESEFVDIVRFLYTLQQQPYMFDVEEVEFEKSPRKNETMITTRLVLGKTFIPSQSGEEAGGKISELSENDQPMVKAQR